MNNSKQLTAEQLKNPDILEKIRKLAEPIIWHMQTKEAYNLALNLEKSLVAANLKGIEPELDKSYQDLINKLKLTALPMLNDEQTIQIVNEHFLDGLKDNIDMKNRLAAKLFSLPLTPRDEFRQQLQRAIKSNQQKIGPWSIEQWLADYNNFIEPSKRTNISPREYLIQNHQASTLAEDDKNKLYTLFHIYDHFLLVTPVVSEEEIRRISGQATRPTISTKATPSPAPSQSSPPSDIQPAPLSAPKSSPQTSSPSPTRPLKTVPPSSRPTESKLGRRDIYQEPIEESTRPGQIEPKIEGNIVDLKR